MWNIFVARVLLNSDRRQLLGVTESSSSGVGFDVLCCRMVGRCGHFGGKCRLSVRELLSLLHHEDRSNTPHRIISHCSLPDSVTYSMTSLSPASSPVTRPTFLSANVRRLASSCVGRAVSKSARSSACGDVC